MQQYDVYTKVPSVSATTTALLDKYPLLNGMDCISVYFDKDFAYRQHYRYGDYIDIANPIVIRGWGRGAKAVNAYQCTDRGKDWCFRMKVDDKPTHQINPSYQFHMLSIHLPAFTTGPQGPAYRYDIKPITNAGTIAHLKSIRGY